MPELQLIQAMEADAPELMALALDAFRDSFEMYGQYPPGLESQDWHREAISGVIAIKFYMIATRLAVFI